jgi:hypothetical protein
MALVRDYFDRAEYKNYALACVENNYEYRLTIRAQKGFVLGHSLRPEIGEFHFDANAPGVSSMQDSHGRWGRYDIAYHLGGTLGGLRDSQQFDLYVNGVWRPAYISCLSDGYPLLYPFQRHPDAYVGCLARASQGVRAARRA